MQQIHAMEMSADANIDKEKSVSQVKQSAPSVKTSLKDFLEYTTAHGFGRLVAASSTTWKLIWIIFCICAHALFWFHFFIIVQDYMKKPVRTKVSLERNRVLDFPVVTICNRNMLRQSKISQEMSIKFETMRNETTRHWKKTPRKGSKLLHIMHSQLHNLRSIVSKIHPDILQEMGHQFHDMVLDCTFDGEDCRESDENKAGWRHLWLENVGNCYMFNRVLPGDGTVPHETMLTGDKHGLRILINLEQYEYLYGISPYAGLKVIVGAQGQMPFPLSDGINVGPGKATSIELVMKRALRLDRFNNKSCVMSGALDTSNIFNKYNTTYTRKACRLSCLSKMEINHCDCTQFQFSGRADLSYCDFTNSTVDDCVDKVQNDFMNGACDAECPSQCIDTSFATTISSYKWPSNQFKSELIKSLHDLANLSMTTEKIRDNLLELHVYYADMDYELVEETYKYSFQDLMSNIGGQMGMWIGLSALTLGEVIELIWIVICFLLYKKNKPMKPISN